MDILSAAIGSMRVGRAEACWVTESGMWGMRYPAKGVSGFHILVRGSGWLITETDRPRALKQGDVVLILAGAEHGLSHAPCRLEDLPAAVMREGARSAEPDDVEILCGAYWLEHGEIHHYLRALPKVIAISPEYDRDPQMRLLVDLLDTDVSRTGPGARVTRSALLDLLLTHILRQWLKKNSDPDRPEIDDPLIADVLREMHADPHKPWTVQRLSESAGISRTAFTKRFTKLVGKPPMAYLSGWRLSYSARLLRETRAPLATIARQVGYSTEFAFGAAFRREYGISPGRFRDLAPTRFATVTADPRT